MRLPVDAAPPVQTAPAPNDLLTMCAGTLRLTAVRLVVVVVMVISVQLVVVARMAVIFYV